MRLEAMRNKVHRLIDSYIGTLTAEQCQKIMDIIKGD